MVYEPREDSFLLQKYVKQYAQGNVLDMGTGTGIQALTALGKTQDVLAIDIDEKAVQGVKEKGVQAIQSDLFANVTGTFDLIIFNPPYLPKDKREDKATALTTTGGKQGHELLERFLQEAKDYLKKEGKILLVISSLTGKAEELFKGYKFKKLDEASFFYEKIYIHVLSSLRKPGPLKMKGV